MLSENKITKKDLKQRLKAWCQSHEEWDLRHASPLLWHERCSVSFLCISAKKNCLRRQTSKKFATHINPSGLDAATCASNTPIWMMAGKIKRIPINLDGCLLICDTGIKGQTSEAIAAVKKRLGSDAKETNAMFDKLQELTLAAKKQLAKNDLLGLGQTFDAAQSVLKTLGVSCDELDEYISVAKDNGALGAKLTGGGRGGCFICLTKNAAQANELAQKLSLTG